MANEVEMRLPCLLDRLIDDSPGQPASSRRRTSVSLKDYRNSVLRDLRWLMNSPQFLRFDRCLTYEAIDEASPHDRDARLRCAENPEGFLYPHVRTSVLNYGTRSLSGMRSESMDPLELENELRDAITAFEPRIDPKTLKVRLVTGVDQPGKLAFEIRGLLWALPYQERINFRTEVDLESGNFDLADQSS